MQTRVLNYRIIIEPEKQGKKTVYNAYCPTLGLADWGDSIDDAIKNIKALIKFHVESLLEEELEVPQENTAQEIITATTVSIQGSGSTLHVAVG
ncbi:type II toxin-antitoxin system HicB family antitoxin [Candidatus Curtissbacteria bacterium]|nr:type II toxin-antitoxin system HicB family antitoxin [Candidatus Curtissbacteria bacterium]